MSRRISRQQFLASLPVAAALLTGCGKAAPSAAPTVSNAPRKKVKVGYMGITCEAPLFVAREKGYFDAEGLEVEMVKCEWTQFKDLLGIGEVHVGQQLMMMFLKPIQEGLDVKFTSGVHRGCLRIQAPANGTIKTVEDLRGKRIGVPGIGTPPFIFAHRVLAKKQINGRNEIEWRAFPSGELGLALDKGAVDAVATSEPIGSLLLSQGKVQNVADLGVDMPFAEEYCCSIMLNGKFATASRDVCAGTARAILRGAKWVEKNPRAAALLSVEKKYLASNPELNAQAISKLRYIPSITGGREAIRTAGQDMMAVGMLKPNTDLSALTKQIYVEFEGITDEWLKSLEVETVAGGQIPADQLHRVRYELAKVGPPECMSICGMPS